MAIAVARLLVGEFMHIVLWRRLDQQGLDACRFTQLHDTWIVEGCAVFNHGGSATNLAYRLVCDTSWRSLHATVTGWIGANTIALLMAREGTDSWRIDGSVREDLTGLQDIDLGFTPASNTNAIRRLCLGEGGEAESTAVWLDTEDWAVKPLRQTYGRLGKHAYDYASPLHNYRATLTVDDFGAVIEYPGLWAMI
jgi:hypothetical protein